MIDQQMEPAATGFLGNGGVVTPFLNKSGNRGIQIDKFKFRLKNDRKTDRVLVWRCCRCGSGITETTYDLQLLKMSDHKHPCEDESNSALLYGIQQLPSALPDISSRQVYMSSYFLALLL